ncbi:MAG TPA: hypothetical protein PLZ84_00700 [Clostridia bacterium]|nr:hypothetical protein [Clostridia bacterium]
MKKGVLKIALLIFSLCLIITFSACKKADNPTGTATVTPEGTATQGPSSGLDFGGITIRVFNPDVPVGSGAAPYMDKGAEGLRMADRINEVQERYNVKIEWVGEAGKASDAWLQYNTSILTGKPAAELAIVDYWVIVQSVEKGGLYQVLNDYEDILELDNADIWNQKLLDEFFTIDGMTFGVEPVKRGIELVNEGTVCFFNKSMLEREGIWEKYNLYEMQRNKTWTWDAMDEIGTKVTKDTDGDSVADQFGLIFIWRITHMGFNASNSDGGSDWGWYGVDSQGVPRFHGREPERLRVLNYFHQMGRKGKGWMIAPDYGQNFVMGPIDDFTKGVAAFYICNGGYLETIAKNNMQDTLGAVAVPMGPDNTTGDYLMARVDYSPWVIARNIENPEAAAYVMKELSQPLFSEEEADIGVEAALADLVGEEEEIIETFKMLGDPKRSAYNKETPFIATWDNAIASYHGSFGSAIIETGYLPER